ncbi:MAG: 30S ribosomal protein S9 [Anaerolineae bacterium]|jgi:small subunit ribosomal protein S9
MAEQQYYEGIGRRKSASARVRLYTGTEDQGQITVNDRSHSEYFARGMDVAHMMEPLEATGMKGRFEISVKVDGGGIRGQAGAVRLGIARALLEWDSDLRPILRRRGYLTRDARVKERKKPGLKGARKAPQYTKR